MQIQRTIAISLFYISILLSISLIESKANESSTVHLECNNNKSYNDKTSRWESSSNKFFINIDPIRKKATTRTDDPVLGDDTVYEIKRITDNQYKLFFYQPINTWSTIITLNRNTGEYTSFSHFQTENPSKGWDFTLRRKGMCKKVKAPNRLF